MSGAVSSEPSMKGSGPCPIYRRSRFRMSRSSLIFQDTLLSSRPQLFDMCAIRPLPKIQQSQNYIINVATSSDTRYTMLTATRCRVAVEDLPPTSLLHPNPVLPPPLPILAPFHNLYSQLSLGRRLPRVCAQRPHHLVRCPILVSTPTPAVVGSRTSSLRSELS